jgi:hypothetical protein
MSRADDDLPPLTVLITNIERAKQADRPIAERHLH